MNRRDFIKTTAATTVMLSLNKLVAAQQLPEHHPSTPMVYRELVTNRLCLAAVH